MKEKGKPTKSKALPLRTRSSTKIATNKENIKTPEVEKRRVLVEHPPVQKKAPTIQSSLRGRKRKEKESLRMEGKAQEGKKGTIKSKRKGEEGGYLRPAHSVEVRRNRFNVDLEENKVYSLSANKRMKRSVESVREMMKASFNKTIQLTPSSFAHELITEQYHSKKCTMPIELYHTLNNSKKLRSKPNSRRNSVSKPDSFSKQYIKPKKPLKKKKAASSGSIDECWPRSMLEDRVSDVLRLSTSQDKGSIIESTEIQQALLTQNQDFNIQQLRELQFRANMMHKRNIKLQGESNSYFNSMATRIQRFWRQSKTKRILSRHITPHQSYNNTLQIPYQSLQLYGNSLPDRHNTYISNLENSENSSKLTVGNEMYESMIKNIKNQELEKWDQLIEMVEVSIKDNTGTKELLKRLIEQSHLNKITLEENTEQILSKTGQQRVGSFKSSPESERRGGSSVERSGQFMSQNSHYSIPNISESPGERELEQQFQELQRVSQPERLFNYRGIERFKDSLPMNTEEEEDPLETQKAVEKLKQKLVELNDNSAQRAGLLYDEEDFSPCLKRDRRSLDKSGEEDILQSSQQSIYSQDEDIHPVARLIKSIVKDIDKEMVCSQITEHLLNQETSLLLKDMAMSSKVYRQLKGHIKEGRGEVKAPKKPKKIRGIKSNLAAVKEYVKSLGDYVLDLETEPLKALEYPSGPTTKEMLKYMRFYDEEEQQQSQTGDQEIVLSSQIFDVHWLRYSQSLTLLKPPQQQQSQIHQDFLKRLTNIHCKLIFDTLNQSLDMLRNYGQFGKPFPWKRVPNFFHHFQEKDQSKSLEIAIQKTIDVASSFCGLILDKEEYGGAPLPSAEYIEQMHQERLSRTLAQELIEGEEKWLFYDDEETEILIEISYAINEQLISEVAKFLLAHYL